MTKTKWFPSTVKPVREGVYLTRDAMGGGEWLNIWTGKYWGWGSRNRPDCWPVSTMAAWCQDREWCGLAEKPE